MAELLTNKFESLTCKYSTLYEDKQMPKVCVVIILYFKITRIFTESYCLLPKIVIMMFYITTKYRVTFYYDKPRLRPRLYEL